MELLIFTGISFAALGAALLIAQAFFKSFSEFFDGLIFSLERELRPVRAWGGLLLMIFMIWIIYLINTNPAAALQFSPIWGVVLIIGIFLMTVPDWLEKISGLASGDAKALMTASRVFGLIFILLGTYILYTVYVIYSML